MTPKMTGASSFILVFKSEFGMVPQIISHIFVAGLNFTHKRIETGFWCWLSIHLQISATKWGGLGLQYRLPARIFLYNRRGCAPHFVFGIIL